MMSDMRTTLTLDDDVVRLIDDAVHQEHRPMKQVVNDALRRALTIPASQREPYHLTPHESAVRPGFDPAGFNRLVDEMDDESIVNRTQRAS
jgi:hypothetical protein